MVETLLDELKRYVRFGPQDEQALRELHPLARGRFDQISVLFYERILENERARAVLHGGESMVGHLRHKLVEWMDKLLTGPWDQPYYELRARIGRMHVRIALPQHYMFASMNVLRQELNQVVDVSYAAEPKKQRAAGLALGKILDLELAIMLHTYREDLLAQQARAERLATFGQLVGSIGHELRNPLGVMESSLFILKGRLPPDERTQKHVGRIGEQLGIANNIITDLLDMIRDKPLRPERLSLRSVAEAATSQLGMLLDLGPLDALPAVEGDPGQLRQVFVNLLENARQAAGTDSGISVQGAVEGRFLAVAVEDGGAGVDEVTRLRLFEPLVTTKPTGIGLGLSLVKRILERHGGTVAYEPRQRGARFVVRLPAALGAA